MLALLLGGGMLAVAVWGVRLCRAIARDAAPLPPGPGGPQANPLISVGSYVVLFGPIAFLGAWICWSALDQMTAGKLRGTVQELREWGQDWFAAEQERSLEPLDDQTARRLGSLGASSARVLGVTIGAILVALGSLGLIEALVESYRPRPIHYGRGFVAARFATYYAVGCGMAIVAGAVILRDTLKRADGRWLLPLKIFTSLVSARIASDEARRRSKALPGSLPGGPTRSHPKADSGPEHRPGEEAGRR